MTMQAHITQKIETDMAPVYLEVVNESHTHNVPAGSESHFKITVASDKFEGLSLIKRHRMINELLKDEIAQIHALALHTMTPDQWFERSGQTPDSPPCLGGSKQ